MDPYRHVTFCGLYCGLCSSRTRVPKLARELKSCMAREGYPLWGAYVYPHFAEFWRALKGFCSADKVCPGCRQEGGPPACGIRKCAQRRGIITCPLCEEFPCGKIEMLAEGYHLLIPDGRRLKEISVEKWEKEQRERAKTGFCYVDVRCHPYTVPEEEE
ncbi:MAG TPA: DUF3795 domain-containing protein [Candidatus Coatesbacteria bacterium]|nr:DUF3795 domain-containing protein [Candidatus Coatesbacteria bacterium]